MTEIMIDRNGSILHVRLNRPDKKNALTGAMYEAAATAFREADKDATVRVVLMDGAGDAFTGGNDLRDFLQQPPTGTDNPVWRFMTALFTCQKPVVAAVHGVAVGIGTTMLFHCDLVYAAEGTRFHMPFVDLGLVPEFGSSVLAPALAGYHRAAEFLLLGQPFDAATAREIGLVNRVVPRDELLQVATTAARALAEKPPASLRLSKMLLRRGLGHAVETAIEEEGRLFAERLVSPEAKEAFSAFLEKRKPDFTKMS